jgi:hypothetical protein
MLRHFFIVLLIGFTGFSTLAQVKDKPMSKKMPKTMNGRQLNDTINENFKGVLKIEFDKKTHYTDYKIISHTKDTTIVDTTLSIKKERLFNHLRKDKFELQSFHNLGAAYSFLAYDFNEISLFPNTGMRVKHQSYINIKDVNYYQVPTPTSELFFKTGIQQGQVLNSVLTTNVSPQLNLSIAYKGLRSLGDYRNALASHQNFRFTSSFTSKNKRYHARIHHVAHNLMNQENGGLTDVSLEMFTTNDINFRDRERLETHFTDAESVLKNKRFYLDHTYDLWKHTDTTHHRNSSLELGHEVSYTTKHYKFDQVKANSFIGEAYQTTIADSTYHHTTHNALFAKFTSPYILGSLGFKTQYTHYAYGYERVLHLEEETIPNRLSGNLLSAEANWDASFKTFSLKSKIGAILSGNLNGNYLSGTATYQKDSLFTVAATLNILSKSPNFNFLLYQSDYINYNWHPKLKNENTQFLGFSFNSDKIVDIKASIALKENYTYFDSLSKPQQYDAVLNYFKARVHKSITYKKFTLDNTLLFQKVLTGSEVLHVPQLITQNSLYYTDYVFKGDPLFLQTGITFKYYTGYKADEFDAVLNEFRLQDTIEVGNYPMLDFFVNGQIRRTRLFFKAENFSSLFLNKNYFATPTQPYRDFKIRFGVVWNFFI